MGFPPSSVGKESICSAGDLVSTPRSGRCPEEGNGNPLKYSYLGNPMDRGAWQVTIHGFTRVRHDLVTKPPPWFEKSQMWIKQKVRDTVEFYLHVQSRILYFPMRVLTNMASLPEVDQHTRTFTIQDSWKQWPPRKQISLLFHGISSRVLSSHHVRLLCHHLALNPIPSANPHCPLWLSSAH